MDKWLKKKTDAQSQLETDQLNAEIQLSPQANATTNEGSALNTPKRKDTSVDLTKERTPVISSKSTRLFNEAWEEYFFIQFNGKPLCVICGAAIYDNHKGSCKRHFYSKHESFVGKALEERKLEFEKLKDIKLKQQGVIKKCLTANECATESSYVLAWEVVQKKKPLTDGEFLKKSFLNISKSLFKCFPVKDQMSIEKSITNLQASDNTIRSRIIDMSEVFFEDLKNELKHCVAWSFAADSSRDIKDKEHMIIWVKYAFFQDNKVVVKTKYFQDLLLTSNCTGQNFLKCFFDATKNIVDFKKLVNAATDGCPSMVGTNLGFIQLLKNKIHVDFLSVHCLIHLQALAGKCISLDNSMNDVVAVISEIKSNALQHRQFQEMLEELESNYGDLLYFTAVRWLSKGKCLSRFLDLIEEIRKFICDKGLSNTYEYLYDDNWICKVSFLADICADFNEFNLKMQDQQNSLVQMVSACQGFSNRINLRAKQLKKTNVKEWGYLKSCTVATIVSNRENFLACLNNVSQGLEDRFGTDDFTFLAKITQILDNPLHCSSAVVSLICKKFPLKITFSLCRLMRY